MKKTLFRLMLCGVVALALSAPTPRAQNPGMVVIVNAGVRLDSLSASDLTRILRGKDDRFEMIGLQQRYYQDALSELAKIGEKDFERLWFQLIVEGKKRERPLLSEEASRLVDFVAKNRGALAVLGWQGLDRLPEEYGVRLVRAQNLPTASQVLALLALQKGRVLYENGRIAEALVELRQGQRLGAAAQNEIKALIKTIETEMELERKHAAAERAWANGHLDDARVLFEQIRAQKPNYKNVASRLVAIQEQTRTEVRQSEQAALYQQAATHETRGELAAALAAYERLADYKDAADKTQKLRTQLEANQKSVQVEKEYAAGMTAFRTRDWPVAVAAFEKVLTVDREYRDVRKKLSEARRNLERESNETVLARYYAEGMEAFNREDWGVAMAAFERLCNINPQYRDAAQRLTDIENRLLKKDLVSTERVSAAAASAQVDSLYQAAQLSLASQDWSAALAALQKIQAERRDYRESATMLALANARLDEARLIPNTAAANNSTASTLGNWSTVLAAAIFLPLAAFFAYTPKARVFYHLMRHNYGHAARIYERLIARHPTRAKYLPKLAHLYLKDGRRDETAMKIYRTVIQLNLATPDREEINSIVAQNFLNEGRTDSDAIEVLEKQLALEMNRKKLTLS